jgi:hypothetical protein
MNLSGIQRIVSHKASFLSNQPNRDYEGFDEKYIKVVMLSLLSNVNCTLRKIRMIRRVPRSGSGIVERNSPPPHLPVPGDFHRGPGRSGRDDPFYNTMTAPR